MAAREIRSYIGPFSEILARINAGDVSSDPYVVSYLQHLLNHRLYYLNIYTLVLERVPARGVLLDCGAGNGLLGLFAKFCGWEKVILNDVSGKFLSASQVLAGNLGICVDQFALGELPELLPTLKSSKIQTIVGTDVVEHIYDLPAFLGAARHLDAGSLVFTTAANLRNRWKSREISQVQVRDEVEFEELRYNMIRELQGFLSPAEVRVLARLTRGLKKADILKAAALYFGTGRMPDPPLHPTNTCDPDTGSWTERLLSFREYRGYFSDAGYKLSISNGFYNCFEPGPKAFLLGVANRLIRVNRRFGYDIAPFILLEGAQKTFD